MKKDHTIFRFAATTFLLLLSGFLILIFANSAFAQSASVAAPSPMQSSPDRGVDYQQVINIWATIISICVTVLVGLTAVNIIYQYTHAEKRMNELAAKYEERLKKLEEQYQLSKMRPWQEILEDARREFLPINEKNLQALETLHTEVVMPLFRKSCELESSAKTNSDDLAQLRQDIGNLPTKDSILQEVGRKYHPPSDLEERMLRKVLNAFLQLRPNEEQLLKISEKLEVTREPGECEQSTKG